jgi:hypothetical protein
MRRYVDKVVLPLAVILVQVILLSTATYYVGVLFRHCPGGGVMANVRDGHLDTVIARPVNVSGIGATMVVFEPKRRSDCPRVSLWYGLDDYMPISVAVEVSETW